MLLCRYVRTTLAGNVIIYEHSTQNYELHLLPEFNKAYYIAIWEKKKTLESLPPPKINSRWYKDECEKQNHKSNRTYRGQFLK